MKWSYQRRLVWFFSVAIAAACILNGASAFLRRTGIVDRAQYREFWNVYAPIYEWRQTCLELRKAEAASPLPVFPDQRPFDRRYVYRITPVEMPLKLVKDAVVAALVLSSCMLYFRQRRFPPLTVNHLPVVGLLFMVLASAVAGLFCNGGSVVAVGLRAFSVLPLCLLAAWFAQERGDRYLARALMAVLACQVLLFPFELFRGIVLLHQDRFGIGLPSRLWGTFVHPSSLGVSAVVILAFALARGGLPRAWRGVGWLLVAGIVFVSGTATAVLCLLLLAGVVVGRRIPDRLRLLPVGLGVGLLVVVLCRLPDILSRHDIYQSLRGRWQILAPLIQENTWWQQVVGRGIGVGTNAVLTVTEGLDVEVASSARFISDSTITALFAQLGALGLLLFYGTLFRAAWLDRSLRVFYLVVLVASITINVLELFPVNVLLVIALARSLTITEDH